MKKGWEIYAEDVGDLHLFANYPARIKKVFPFPSLTLATP
jgi:hypothetical protein